MPPATWLYKRATQKWNELTGKLNDLSTRLEKHETEHETATTWDELSGKLEKHENETSKTLKVHGKRLTDLEEGQANLKGSQATMDERLANIKKALPP